MISAEGFSDSGTLESWSTSRQMSREHKDSHPTLAQCFLKLGNGQMPTAPFMSQSLVIQSDPIQMLTYPPTIEERRPRRQPENATQL